EVESVRINGGENHRRSAKKSVFAGTHCFGADVLNFPRPLVEATDLSAVDDVRIERIGRDITVLLYAYRIPFTQSDRAVIATAHRSDRATLLLPPVDPVRYSIVRNHMVELRGRLVVPRAP